MAARVMSSSPAKEGTNRDAIETNRDGLGTKGSQRGGGGGRKRKRKYKAPSRKLSTIHACVWGLVQSRFPAALALDTHATKEGATGEKMAGKERTIGCRAKRKETVKEGGEGQ